MHLATTEATRTTNFRGLKMRRASLFAVTTNGVVLDIKGYHLVQIQCVGGGQNVGYTPAAQSSAA